MDEFVNVLTTTKGQFPLLVHAIMSLAAAFTILIFGWIFAKWIKRRVANVKIGHHEIDATLRPVLASLVFYIIMALTLYAFLIKLGVPANSLLAIFGAAGLAIGLALKDTLSNIACGVMLLVLRPLDVGNFIDTGSVSGVVEEIGLFSTTLKTGEGIYIYIPNGQVWTNRIQNFGRHTIRKAIIDIGVGYETNLEQAQALLLEVLNHTPDLVSFETGAAPSAPEIYITSFGDNAINVSCRCWLPGNNWLARTSDLRVSIKSALDKANIEIPFPQRVVTLKNVT